MLIRSGLLLLIFSMGGPFSRCNDEPPSIPPMPRYLDAGLDAYVPPDLKFADTVGPDQYNPDLVPHDDIWVDTTGRACTAGAKQCGGGMKCIFVTDKKVGVCASTCDLKSPLLPTGCPPQTACAVAPDGMVSTTDFCYRKCALAPGQNSCPAGVACHFGLIVGKPSQGLCLGPPGCSKDSDCPVRTSTTCDLAGGKKCPAGQLCHPVNSAATTAGQCAKPGKCDVKSGLCLGHSLGNASAKVGDPCSDDTACGGEMTCLMERDDKTTALAGGKACTSGAECCSRVCKAGKCAAGLCVTRNRNGYCTMVGCTHAAWTARACPSGSVCNKVKIGGQCQLGCDLTKADQCRGQATDLLGDYECRAWNNLSMGGVPITSGAVCDPGPDLPCGFLALSKLDCSSVGVPATNASNMSCRGLDGTQLAKGSPNGFCLDDTASGAKKR